MESTNIGSPVSGGGEDSEEPSLIQYRSKRRCVVEREKKKKKEWWEEDDVLSDEEDYGDVDSDGSDGPRKKQRKKQVIMPSKLLPPPNRIFMFSTELANRAAEAVMQGRVPSIVAYHMAQPQNQHFLRLQRNTSEFMMNSSGNPFRYGNYPGHVEAMFSGNMSGRPGGASNPMSMGPGFNSQYQQYLKQQQQQLEPRNAVAVDELQQMLFGPGSNGTKGMFPPTGIPHGMENQGGARPQFGAYPGHVPPGFQQQQMFINNQERFRFPQPQNFPSQQQQQQQQQQQLQQQGDAPPQSQAGQILQQGEQKPTQPDEQQRTKPEQPELHEGQEPTLPPSEQQQPAQQPPTQPSMPQPAPPSQQVPPQLPVLSPGSSISSSSPLGSAIRSPPPYPSVRTTEMNTLPGASSVGAPSPTNTNSPQTPHAPLTPRIPTTLASPNDGQRSPFSPSAVPTSGYPTQSHVTHQNIREHPGTKLARVSPNADKPIDKMGMPTGFNMGADSRMSGYPAHTRQDLLPQRPNSLNLTRSPLAPPPNKSPFLGAGATPMPMHPQHSPMGELPSSHHASKFSVESLTAPSEKERFYHPRLPPMQAASPYAAYAQNPGLYYGGNKFHPSMLGQGYQFPAHLQTAPQQFFPPNLPPNMYPPHGSFPIHHAGNREGGM